MTLQEKLDFILGIKRLAVLFIKDVSLRPAELASAVQRCLNTLWDVFISTAEALDFDEDAALHDHLVLQLLWTMEFDTLCRGLHPSASVNERFPSWEAYQFAERLQCRWDELLLGHDSEESKSKQRNLAAFSAKVLAAGICRDSVMQTALSCLRDVLEAEDEEKVVARLAMAVTWIDHCHHQLLAFLLGDRSGEGDRESGDSLDRWLSWRKRFQGFSHHADAAVATEAKTGFMSMISCGLDLDCDVPGEAIFREQVAVAMRDELVASGKPSVEIHDIDVDVDWVE
ncbi:hypothetical protein B0T14DRAFT_532105 [Immersiella caudata]|uniref:Uncharacterized protein n=1 Tax=Immersiella caudata TaxID=314043 RepID=A0AA40CAN5_9PEZI|nr:hypothetical protein B0T14DRAFT_532105 [Immersiella caudata]